MSLVCCIPFLKTYTGFKNPEVETKKSIWKTTSQISFDSNTEYNLIVSEPKDTTEIWRTLISSMGAQFLIFDQHGKRHCLQQFHGCQIIDDSTLYDFESELINCDLSDSINSTINYANIRDFLNNTETHNGRHLEFNQLPEVDYYLVYLWGKFTSNKKRLKEDYSYFSEQFTKSNNTFVILRLNCDLREDWGLKKGKKLKIKFKKIEGKEYKLQFGELPY